MELSKIKRVKELTSVEEVNEHLKRGWQIINYLPTWVHERGLFCPWNYFKRRNKSNIFSPRDKSWILTIF